MRIDEQSTVPLTQAQQKNHHNQMDFEQWITTPTKQNSGDEYYWQHQNQLEQSCLHFKPQLNHAQKSESINSSDDAPLLKNTTVSVLNLKDFVRQDYLMDIPFKTMNNVISKDSLTCSVKAIHQQQPQVIPSDKNTCSTLKASVMEQSKKIKTATLQHTNANQEKNHHLFIENKEAQITMGIQGLHVKEQKKIIQIVKKFLKDNGIVLNKLIINGVKK